MCRDVSLLKLFELQIFADNIHNISTYGNKTKFSPHNEVYIVSFNHRYFGRFI
jgi:hypothetical protein